MSYQFPDDDTLIRYLALLRAAILEARLAAAGGESRRTAQLLDAIENVPDLLQQTLFQGRHKTMAAALTLARPRGSNPSPQFGG